jgi:YidC/Oxa1 family membrane protein insertase
VIAVAVWQAILNGLGSFLARLYDFIPNYGVDIILLTLMIRLLLLPLGVKQIRSMQATQALQPKIKALQQKYKGDRAKLNEEMMKLYKEAGHNPLSGCFPLLLQLPVLIALFSVLRTQGGYVAQGNGGHIPKDSALYTAIVSNDTNFLGTNLLCSAIESGKDVDLTKGVPPQSGRQPDIKTLDCGGKFPANIPYYLLALLMVGTTYFQQRQMTRASPGGAGANRQQQTIMRIMPLLFGFWGFIFPAGLVVYWSTTNGIQIGQQWFLLHRRHAPLKAGAAPDTQDADGKGSTDSKQSKGGSTPMRAAETPRDRRPTGGVVPRRGNSGSGGSNPGRSGGGGSGRSSGSGGRRNNQRRQTGGGGGNAGSRKKRPKR